MIKNNRWTFNEDLWKDLNVFNKNSTMSDKVSDHSDKKWLMSNPVTKIRAVILSKSGKKKQK